jgi:hypothetical protein
VTRGGAWRLGRWIETAKVGVCDWIPGAVLRSEQCHFVTVQQHLKFVLFFHYVARLIHRMFRSVKRIKVYLFWQWTQGQLMGRVTGTWRTVVTPVLLFLRQHLSAQCARVHIRWASVISIAISRGKIRGLLWQDIFMFWLHARGT